MIRQPPAACFFLGFIMTQVLQKECNTCYNVKKKLEKGGFYVLRQLFVPGIRPPPHAFAPFFAAGHPVSYAKGQIIYLQGQEPTHLYCLRSGAVRTLITSDAGEERLLTTYGPGSIFGEASFFDGMPRVSTAEAAADCTIVRLSHDTVDHLFSQHPELASAMITYLARTVRLLSGHVDTMSFQAADKRLGQSAAEPPGHARSSM